MKKFLLKFCVLMIMLSIVSSMMGCSNVYYEKEECRLHINEFMDSVFQRDVDRLSSIAYMDSTDVQLLMRYKSDAFISKVMEKATYDVYMDNVRQYNQKIYFDVFVSVPDYTTAYRRAPSFGDLEYYSQAIDDQLRKSYKTKEVTVIFSVKYNVWIVNNLKELLGDFYEPMYEVVSEGRETTLISDDFMSAGDKNAFYRRVYLTEVNFQHAVIEARSEDTEIRKIEGADMKAFGVDGSGVDYILESVKGESKVSFLLYHCTSEEEAKKFFEAHSDPNQKDPLLYYQSDEWGYSRDTKYEGINMYYWSNDLVVYAELPKSEMENPDIYTEYVTFWSDLEVMG